MNRDREGSAAGRGLVPAAQTPHRCRYDLLGEVLRRKQRTQSDRASSQLRVNLWQTRVCKHCGRLNHRWKPDNPDTVHAVDAAGRMLAPPRNTGAAD